MQSEIWTAHVWLTASVTENDTVTVTVTITVTVTTKSRLLT